MGRTPIFCLVTFIHRVKLSTCPTTFKIVSTPVNAAQALLDIGWGKPKVELVTEGVGGYLEALRYAIFNAL